jgi:hypothetical protein
VPARGDAVEDSASSDDENHDDSDGAGSGSDDGELPEKRSVRLAALQSIAVPVQPMAMPLLGGGDSAAAGGLGKRLTLISSHSVLSHVQYRQCTSHAV